MQPFLDISEQRFSSELTNGQVRTSMIIQLAIGAGTLVFFFLALVVGLVGKVEAPDPDNLKFLEVLTIAVICFFLIIAIVGQSLYRSRFTAKQLELALKAPMEDETGKVIASSPLEKALMVIRTVMILRTAAFEAPAMFGLVVLMVAATDGMFPRVSWLWINLLPMVTLLGLITLTLPTKERLTRIFKEEILKTE